MTLNDMHYQAIEILACFAPIAGRLRRPTDAEVAAQVGVARETVCRWRADEDFAGILAERRAEWMRLWREETHDFYLAHRRGRVEELCRLYETIPDMTILLTRGGNEWAKSNANEKVKVLDQIAREMAADVAGEMEALRETIAGILAGNTVPLRARALAIEQALSPPAGEARPEEA